jgi:hypothetical protein
MKSKPVSPAITVERHPVEQTLHTCFARALACLAAACLAGCSLLPRKAPENSEGQNIPAPAAAPVLAEEEVKQDGVETVRKPLRWQDIIFFWWPKPNSGPPVAAPLQTAGVASFVNLPGNFVILETSMASSLPVGQELSALKDGRITSKVKVTADRRPPFVIAEILEGVPQRGDRFHPIVLD